MQKLKKYEVKYTVDNKLPARKIVSATSTAGAREAVRGSVNFEKKIGFLSFHEVK